MNTILAFNAYKPTPQHRKWWVRGNDHRGNPRRVPAFRSSTATETLARSLSTIVDYVAGGRPIPLDMIEWVAHKAPAAVRDRLISWGTVSPAILTVGRTVAEHLEDWRQHLVTQGRLEQYIADRVGHARGLFERTGVFVVSDIDPGRVQAAAQAWANEVFARAGRNPKKKWSATTLRNAIGAAKAFTRWLWRFGRAPQDLLASLSRPKVNRADWKRLRRFLTEEEEDKLIAYTSRCKKRRSCMTGKIRAIFYRTAIQTGFRASALRDVLVEHVRSVDGRVVILPPPGGRKRRVPAVVLEPLAGDLRKLAKGRAGTESIWGASIAADSRWFAAGLAADCKAAGVPRLTFHGLRHTLGTRLAQANVHPRTAQEVMGHGEITTTMAYYTHIAPADLSAAAESVAQSVALKRSKRVKNGQLVRMAKTG